MPIEFAFLDWLQQYRTPVMDALAVFFNNYGEHGEIWIVLTLVLLAFRRTRKAGISMAVALVLYLVTGDYILKPIFNRARPCDVNSAMQILVARPGGSSFPSGHTASAFAASVALFLHHRRAGIAVLLTSLFIGFTRMYLYVHFPSDVAAGIVLGVALGFAAKYLTDHFVKHSHMLQKIV